MNANSLALTDYIAAEVEAGLATGGTIAMSDLSNVSSPAVLTPLTKEVNFYDFASDASIASGNDLTGELQAAINSAQSVKYPVALPRTFVGGVSRPIVVTSQLLITDQGVGFKGAGAGLDNPDYAGNSVVQYNGPATTSAVILWGNQSSHITATTLDFFTVDCNGLAAEGVVFADVQGLSSRRFRVYSPTKSAIRFTNSGKVLANPCGWMTFEDFSCWCRHLNGPNANGVVLDGMAENLAGGVSMLTFIRPRIVHQNGHGWISSGGDGTSLIDPFFYNNTGGGDTGYGVYWNPGSYRSDTANATLYPCSIGIDNKGGQLARVLIDGDPLQYGNSVVFDNYSAGDGAVAPVGRGSCGLVGNFGYGRRFGLDKIGEMRPGNGDAMTYIASTSTTFVTTDKTWALTYSGAGAPVLSDGGQPGSATRFHVPTGTSAAISLGGFTGSGQVVANLPYLMTEIAITALPIAGVIRLGLMSGNTEPPAVGWWFEFDPTKSSHWVLVVMSASGTTRVDTGVGAVTEIRQFYLAVVLLANGVFQVNGYTRTSATSIDKGVWGTPFMVSTNLPGTGQPAQPAFQINSKTDAVGEVFLYHFCFAADLEGS